MEHADGTKEREIAAMKKALELAGGPTEMGKSLGVSYVAVGNWLRYRLPAERVLSVEKLTGVSRYELRPDIYPDPVIEASGEVLAILGEHADDEAAKRFIRYRARKFPLTSQAARRIANQLHLIVKEGGNAADALDLAAERGWRTVTAVWYARATESAGKPRGGHAALIAGLQDRADQVGDAGGDSGDREVPV